MIITKIENNNIICAVVTGEDVVIKDSQSALDLLMTAKYDYHTKNILIDKNLIAEDFLFSVQGLQEKSYRNMQTMAVELLFMEIFPNMIANH